MAEKSMPLKNLSFQPRFVLVLVHEHENRQRSPVDLA
jgi:hypothetical protein